MFDSSGLINVLLLNTVHFTSAFIIYRSDTGLIEDFIISNKITCNIHMNFEKLIVKFNNNLL